MDMWIIQILPTMIIMVLIFFIPLIVIRMGLKNKNSKLNEINEKLSYIIKIIEKQDD